VEFTCSRAECIKFLVPVGVGRSQRTKVSGNNHYGAELADKFNVGWSHGQPNERAMRLHVDVFKDLEPGIIPFLSKMF
jgi:hypothetical protein